MSGWGVTVFSAPDYWWVVPVLAVHVGGIAGAWLYTGIVQGRCWTISEDRKSDTLIARTGPPGPGTNYLQVSKI